jgi:hypothetical protein
LARCSICTIEISERYCDAMELRLNAETLLGFDPGKADKCCLSISSVIGRISFQEIRELDCILRNAAISDA